MTKEDFNRILAQCESVTDKALAYLIALPAPFTAIALFVYSLLLVYVGSRL